MSQFESYETDGFFDELLTAGGKPRAESELLIHKLEGFSGEALTRKQQAAERVLLQMGITFNVYGADAGTERIFPFDIVPRIIPSSEWSMIERGLKQRVHALNEFVNDIYNDRKILRDKVVPEELIASATSLRPACEGLRPPRGIWCHITGTDLVRDADGRMYVLEDNLRCPSGVSYVLENRHVLKRTFPEVFEACGVRPIDDYPSRLLDMLQYVAPAESPTLTVAVLSPGPYNSAYFEHSFLARQMGVQLVEGRDLAVVDDFLCMRTTHGWERVDVLYRRIDDDFLDPEAFRPDSLLGVPGIMDVYRRGRVALVNAPGTGIADDKVIYALVPKIIRYYEGEDPILNNVPTFICSEEKDRKHVLENIDKLVVKAANESGGYGMLVGPHATAEECDEFRRRVSAAPRNYIAQPTLSLSRAPVLVEDHFEGRHVDLRPFVLYGRDIYVMPGGLTRVALRRGSLVVNSSQGGGSKDTWVVDRPSNQPQMAMPKPRAGAAAAL